MKRRQVLIALGALAASSALPLNARADGQPAEELLGRLASEVAKLEEGPAALFARARGTINPDAVVDVLEADFYRAYPQGVAGPVQPLDALDSVYAAAVGAIYLWFTGKSYTLSAELLGWARTNTVVDSTYNPSNGYRLKSTTTAASLRSPSTPASGSGAFPNSGSVYNRDAYYAIHRFTYTKAGSLVTIRDRYDYADKSGYDSIAGAATQTMYNAQQRGIIKPFRMTIGV